MEQMLRQIMKRKSGMNDEEYDNWIGKVHQEATQSRKQKIKEYLDSPKPAELETSIIKQWCEHYGNETY